MRTRSEGWDRRHSATPRRRARRHPGDGGVAAVDVGATLLAGASPAGDRELLVLAARWRAVEQRVARSPVPLLAGLVQQIELGVVTRLLREPLRRGLLGRQGLERAGDGCPAEVRHTDAVDPDGGEPADLAGRRVSVDVELV